MSEKVRQTSVARRGRSGPALFRFIPLLTAH